MSIISTGISAVISPFRGYIIAGAGVVLVSAFGWYTFHERSVQHAKDVSAALSEIKVVARKDVLIEQTVDATVAKEEVEHEASQSAPAEPNIGVVCHDTGGHAVPGPTNSDVARDGSTDSGKGDLFDPSGQLLGVGTKYDKWIKQLQADNAALRKELADASKARK